MPRVLVVHVGLDTTGGDGVDGNLLLAAVDGEGAGEALDGSLGAGVESMVVDTSHGSSDGRGENDAAATATVLEALLGNEELATAVEVENTIEELLSDVEFGRPHLSARVGDDELNVSVVGHDTVEEVGHLSGLADVGLESGGVRAEGPELGDGVLGGLGAGAVVDDDVAAALGELEGDALADAAAGTGDYSDLAGEGLSGVDGGVDDGGGARHEGLAEGEGGSSRGHFGSSGRKK